MPRTPSSMNGCDECWRIASRRTACPPLLRWPASAKSKTADANPIRTMPSDRRLIADHMLRLDHRLEPDMHPHAARALIENQAIRMPPAKQRQHSKDRNEPAGSAEKNLGEFRTVAIGQRVLRAEQVKEVEHGLARGVVAEAPVAPHDLEVLGQSLVMVAARRQHLGQQEPAFEVVRPPGHLGAQALFIATATLAHPNPRSQP